MNMLGQTALFVLFLAFAHGAPTISGRKLDYMEGKILSLELNEMARKFHNEVEISNELANVSDPPLMIRSEDQCDPESLKKNQEPCLSRVVLALKNYSRIFGENGLFQTEDTDCNKWRTNATSVSEVTTKLLVVLKESPASLPMNVDNWMIEGYLCRNSVERLYSFSIVTARIFSFLSSLHHPA